MSSTKISQYNTNTDITDNADNADNLQNADNSDTLPHRPFLQ